MIECAAQNDAKMLADFRYELLAELHRINGYWLDEVLTEQSYIGEVSLDGAVNTEADKGIILATRMLWYFSEAAMYLEDDRLIKAASKMYHFICDHFIDEESGGVFWMLNATGLVINDRKQVYAQAFAVYALSAYARLTGSFKALSQAREIFLLIEEHAFDQENGGYLEAFSRGWGELEDIRLSEKDLPSEKTMNTHLHIIEAYAGLLRAEKSLGEKVYSSQVRFSLLRLLEIYRTRFYNAKSRHLHMFLSKDWRDESTEISYGHDIESSWLVWEAVSEIGDSAISDKFLPMVKALCEATVQEGMSRSNDCVYDLFVKETATIEKDRVWWVQAEAMVGFMNAWELTGDSRYIGFVSAIWHYIKYDLLDLKQGEWHWIAKSDQVPSNYHYKVGPWKGPYHNGRSLLELCVRIDLILSQ